MALGVWDDGDDRLDLIVHLPAALPVEVHDGSGSTIVSGVAALEIEDGSGELEVSDVAGRMRIKDGSGSLTVSRAGGTTVDGGSGRDHRPPGGRRRDLLPPFNPSQGRALLPRESYGRGVQPLP